MSIERAVAIATPLFAAVAGALTAWLGKHFPGLPTLNPADVTALIGAGALSATAAALKWLHGRARWVEINDDADTVRGELRTLKAQVAANPNAGPALADIEALLTAHEGQVETVIDEHVPAAVSKALALLFAGLGQSAVAPVPAQEPSVQVVPPQSGTTTIPLAGPVGEAATVTAPAG